MGKELKKTNEKSERKRKKGARGTKWTVPAANLHATLTRQTGLLARFAREACIEAASLLARCRVACLHRCRRACSNFAPFQPTRVLRRLLLCSQLVYSWSITGAYHCVAYTSLLSSLLGYCVAYHCAAYSGTETICRNESVTDSVTDS